MSDEILSTYSACLKSADGKIHIYGYRYPNGVTLFNTKRLVNRKERKIVTSELLVTDETFTGMVTMFSELRNREFVDEKIIVTDA